MQREVSAIVLCILAQAAAAECASTPAATAQQVTPVVAENAYNAQTVHAAPAVYNARTAAAMPAAPNAARKGELIKAAAAGTRDDGPPSASSPRDSMSAHAADEDHPRRGGTAMLLAALALMSGIALRRYGARDT